MQLLTKCSLLLSKKIQAFILLLLPNYRDVIWDHSVYLEDLSLFHIYRMQKARTLTNASIYLLNCLTDYVTLFLLQEMKLCKKQTKKHLKPMCHGYTFNSML